MHDSKFEESYSDIMPSVIPMNGIGESCNLTYYFLFMLIPVVIEIFSYFYSSYNKSHLFLVVG